MRKALKYFGATFFAFCYMVAVGACGMADGHKGGYGAYGDAEISGGMDSSSPEDGKEDDANKKDETVERPAGLITAGAWNDNDYYQDWVSLFMQEEDKEGRFTTYSKSENSWGFQSCERRKVTVTQGEKAVAGAKVYVRDQQGQVMFRAVTDANGVAYVFTDVKNGSIDACAGEMIKSAAFTTTDREITIDVGADAHAEKKDIIELMFVVDVTGSMGDELSFLNNEIADVVDRVAYMHSEAQINLALLFYRDKKVDSESFKYYDFEDVTTEEGMAKQQAAIAAQRAKGGGDYPESVDDALEMAMGKQWSESATTKILFHILDAPPHEKEENKTRFNGAVLEAAKKGIRICPVLCSGADMLTEYVMREAAVYTGGTFVFVTDDSGIGNPHYDPGLPNATVETLNSLMVRLINGYHSGTFADPIYWRDEILMNTPMPIS